MTWKTSLVHYLMIECTLRTVINTQSYSTRRRTTRGNRFPIFSHLPENIPPPSLVQSSQPPTTVADHCKSFPTVILLHSPCRGNSLLAFFVSTFTSSPSALKPRSHINDKVEWPQLCWQKLKVLHYPHSFGGSTRRREWEKAKLFAFRQILITLS